MNECPVIILTLSELRSVMRTCIENGCDRIAQFSNGLCDVHTTVTGKNCRSGLAKSVQDKIDAFAIAPRAEGHWVIKIFNSVYAVSYGHVGEIERAQKWPTKEDALLWAHGALEIGVEYEAVFIRDS